MDTHGRTNTRATGPTHRRRSAARRSAQATAASAYTNDSQHEHRLTRSGADGLSGLPLHIDLRFGLQYCFLSLALAFGQQA